MVDLAPIAGYKMREVININKSWSFVKENVGLEKVLLTKSKKVNIPHTWNNLDGQDGGSDYYRGVCWYSKKLGKLEIKSTEVLYLEFEGVHSICDVYLNGKLLTHHEGGFSTFRTRIDQNLNDENLVVVSVDNKANGRVYPQMADFTFFGGIYRDVNLVKTSATHFDLDYYGGPGVTATPAITDNKAIVKVDCYITNYNNNSIKAEIMDMNGNVVSSATSLQPSFEMEINDVHLWNGRIDPYLY